MSSGTFNTVSKKVTVNGIIDHARLINRNLANQHPISAISGLQEELDILKANTNQQVLELEDIVKQAKKEVQDTSFEIRENYASKKGLEDAVDQLEKNIDAKYSTKSDYLALYSDFLKVQSEVEDDIEKAINNLKEALEREDSDLSKDIEDLEEALTTAESTLQEAIAVVQGNLNSTKAEFQAVINDVNSAYQTADESLEERLTAQIDRAIAALKGEDLETGEGGAVDNIASLKKALNTAITDLEQADTDNKAALEDAKVKLSNAANIYYIKNEADQKSLDAVLDELYQGSGNAKNITYTNSDEEETPLNEVITDLYQKSGDAKNITYTSETGEQKKLDEVINELYDGSGNAKNIKYTVSENEEKQLDEVINELYQGSGDAKNITYTSGEDEKPLNEVIDELYQGSGSAANISYTKDKTVHAAISDLETNLGVAAEGANKQFKEIDDRLNTVLEYINTLHPLTITVSNGSSTTKHFSDSGNINVEWKTNRGIGENTMVFSDIAGSTICSPKNIPTSPAETVTYAHTWSPYNNIKDTLTQASASGKVEAKAKISIDGLNIEKSISCTYAHYVYCGMLNKPFGEVPNLSQSITDNLSTADNRFLQTTGSLNTNTYKVTAGGGYLYYAAPISYVAGKTLVVIFDIGKTYLDTYNTTVTLKFGDLNVEYAVYQITNDLQNGDVTAAISVQN